MEELMKDKSLDEQMLSLIVKHGIHKIVFSLISACDILADRSSDKYDKRQEDYWRDGSTKLYAAAKKLQDFSKTNRRNP